MQAVSADVLVAQVRGRRVAHYAPVPGNDGGNKWSTCDVLVGIVSCDWLTLTTWSSQAFAEAVHLLRTYSSNEVVETGFAKNGYVGFRGGGYFAGVGLQKNPSHGAVQEHFKLELHGSVADSFLQSAIDNRLDLGAWNCTRVDVQYTHPEAPPEDFSLRAVADHLSTADWSRHKGGRPQLRAVLNYDTGLDTLYIGSRQSRRLQRVYVKGCGDTQLLRWETEFKGKLAADLWGAVITLGRDVLPGVLAGEFAVLPELPGWIAAVGEAVSSVEAQRLTIQRTPTPAESTLAWLHTSVLPSVRRLGASGDDRVQQWVSGFLAECREAVQREQLGQQQQRE